MEGKVLVAYGSKYGATKEMAEKMGEVLREEGLDADVMSAKSVGEPSQYGAIVIGSGAYFGKWRKEAAAFLKANEEVLGDRPVWVFTSGPTGEGDPLELAKGWRLPKSLEPVMEIIKPRDIALFSGKVDAEDLSILEKKAIKTVKAPVGDFRDWDAITTWAQSIAAALKE